MRLVRLLAVFFRVGALGELAYRGNFLMRLFEAVLDLATALAGLAVVFSHTTTLGGWSADELLAVLGVYFLVGGAIRLVIQPSMEQLLSSVRDGSLDFALTRPVDSQLLVSIQRVEVWQLVDFVMGAVVLALALVRMGSRVGVGEVAAFAVALLAGGTIVYSVWLILASTAFWLVRVENVLVIFQTMYEAARWPVGIYPDWLRFSLTFLVPVAFAVTVPAEALAGKLGGATLVGALALAAALFVAARIVFRLGTKRYSGASS
jgi:ABC-2 type transport system permease protein